MVEMDESDRLLSFIRDDLSDLADALGPDRPIERERRALVEEYEAAGIG